MPLYEEFYYLKSGRYVDYMRASLRRALVTQPDKLIYSEISAQTQQIVAGNNDLRQTFGEGFNETNRTLEWGFSNIADKLGEISSGIEDLRADFNYSINLLIEQMQIQRKVLEQVVEKLDAIHKTLESPLLTQARELYRIGLDRLQKGLIDKALEAFIKAEEKNDTDFFIEFQLGKLYLYGIDEDDNVIDLKKAREHLRLAVRYGKGELKILPEFNRFLGEACFHASVAYYVSAGEPEVANKDEEVREFLSHSLDFIHEAIEVYPKVSEFYYHYAKYSALLGEGESALKNLETAIKIDKRYTIKAEMDKDFDSVREDVIKLYEKLRDESEAESREKLNRAKEAFSRIYVYSEEGNNVKKEAEQLIQNSEDLISAHTYFSNLEAIANMDKAIEIMSDYYEAGLWANATPFRELENEIVPAHSRDYIIFKQETGPIYFSADSKYLIALVTIGETDCRYRMHIYWHTQFRVFDITTGRLVRTYEIKSAKEMFEEALHECIDSWGVINFSSDGKSLVIVDKCHKGMETPVQVWDLKEGNLVKSFQVGAKIKHAKVGSDGRLYALYKNDFNNVYQIDISEGKMVKKIPIDLSKYINTDHCSDPSMEISHRYNFLIISFEGGRLTHIRSIDNGELVGRFESTVDDASVSTMSPDETMVAFVYYNYSWRGGERGSCEIWDIEKGKLIRSFPVQVQEQPRVVFSFDSKFVAVADQYKEGFDGRKRGRLRLWHIHDSQLTATINGLREDVQREEVQFAFSPDGMLLATVKEAIEKELRRGEYCSVDSVVIWKRRS